MAGRKPLPTNIKIVKGTSRNCRLNKSEPRPKTEIPSAPDQLSKQALIEWGRVTGQLYQLGLLTEIDMSALAAYCQTYGRWVEAEEKLKVEDLVVETKQGNIIQNPLLGVANRALELMHKYLTEFGMTPSSRSRVTVSKKQDAKNPFAKIMGE